MRVTTVVALTVVVCLMLLVSSVALAATTYKGPFTDAPLMLWKTSGQVACFCNDSDNAMPWHYTVDRTWPLDISGSPMDNVGDKSWTEPFTAQLVNGLYTSQETYHTDIGGMVPAHSYLKVSLVTTRYSQKQYICEYAGSGDNLRLVDEQARLREYSTFSIKLESGLLPTHPKPTPKPVNTDDGVNQGAC